MNPPIDIREAAYKGNIGFEEMVKFYSVATPVQIEVMEKTVKKGDWEGVKKIFKKVLGVQLK